MSYGTYCTARVYKEKGLSVQFFTLMTTVRGGFTVPSFWMERKIGRTVELSLKVAAAFCTQRQKSADERTYTKYVGVAGGTQQKFLFWDPLHAGMPNLNSLSLFLAFR